MVRADIKTRIKVNGHEITLGSSNDHIQNVATIVGLLDLTASKGLSPDPDAVDIICMNGHQLFNRQHGGSVRLEDLKVQDLADGDEILAFGKGDAFQRDMLERALYGRHTPGVQKTLAEACVGVAGLGGLGSNAAISLARMGIGKLVLVDFDVVDPTNINRQAYVIKHIGRKKTDCIKEIIEEVNPFIQVEIHNKYLDTVSSREVFAGCQVVVEAFDDPRNKAMLCNALLEMEEGPLLVAASGVAGYGNSNGIRTKSFGARMMIVGDLETEAAPGMGLMAPRVAIAANHQANAVVEWLLEERNRNR